MKLFRRITISTATEPDNLTCLPTLEPSKLTDKLCLLLGEPWEVPATQDPCRAAFSAAIKDTTLFSNLDTPFPKKIKL